MNIFYFYLEINSLFPIYGRKDLEFELFHLPAGSFSKIAATVRPIAKPEPFSV